MHPGPRSCPQPLLLGVFGFFVALPAGDPARYGGLALAPLIAPLMGAFMA
jgi:hypothetical protein